MERRLAVAILSIFLVAGTAGAQLTLPGNDPAGIRWNSIQGSHYNVIFPAKYDSLGRAYLDALERYSLPVSRSIGFVPNQSYHLPMPVTLHPFYSSANGAVTWTPRRMELYTCPSAYSPEPMSWRQMLALHESRHVAQMQFAAHRGRKFWHILTGELAAGAFAALYPGPAFFEGDAVVAETGLSNSGRGRCADFLEYYMVAFDNGDWRDWYKWRYGSMKNYTPDYYRVGYLTFAGMRTLYDQPLFTQKYFDRMFRHKAFNIPFFNFQNTVKELSGRNFKSAFREIEQYFQDGWAAEAAKRGPFMHSEQVSREPRHFESLTGTALADGNLYSIRSGLDLPRAIVTKEGRFVTSFASGTSSLMWSEPLKRIFWSEPIPDPRWELKSASSIRYMTPGSTVKHSLTSGKRYFNPAPSPDDERIAAVEYPYDGSTAVVILDGRSGEELSRWEAPDSLQVVEAAWAGSKLVVSAISTNGFGLYSIQEGFAALLAPQPVKVKQLRSDKGESVTFVSDRTGVNELYRFDIRSLRLEQLTNTRYGASDFVFCGDSLYFSSLSVRSRGIRRTDTSELPQKEVDFADRHRYPIADKLSEQEDSLSEGYGASVPAEPRKYSKIGHLIHFHSWAPVYFNYDNILNLSFDELYLTAGLGATALFQNDLGTMSGMLAYSAHRDPDNAGGPWRHSGHAKFTYSGWYPVLEGKIDFNDRCARDYFRIQEEGHEEKSLAWSALDSPGFDGSLKAYIPLNFSSGGWSRGLIPQVQYSLSNNTIGTTQYIYRNVEQPDGSVKKEIISTDEHGKSLMQQVTLGLRGYSARPTAPSGIYPRWGIGAEVLLRLWLGGSEGTPLNDMISPNLGTYLYGYVPGIIPQHGLKLSATYQRQLSEKPFLKSNYISVTPRGMTSSPLNTLIAGDFPNQMKLSADYAMAFAPVDWSFLCPAAYIRNFELTAHFDYALYRGGDVPSLGLLSAGADLVAHLSNLLWIPYDTRIGVSYNYNGGRSFDTIAKSVPLGRNTFSLIFSIDM